MKKVLIVEDDINLGTPLAGVLEGQGFMVEYLIEGDGVIETVKDFNPDIILMDVMLEGKQDGFELGRLIRADHNIPIIFTTSRDGNDDLKAGFSIDNTDYVRKPYRLMEVMVRIDSMLTRQNIQIIHDNAYQIGKLTFFPGEQSLKISCDNIRITKNETAVLIVLCKNMGSYVSKKNIVNTVWNERDSSQKEGSLNTILYNLRKYFENDPHVNIESRMKLGVKLTVE